MAARGINKAIIVGNLGDDPDLKYLTSGTAVCKISVATSESWTDKNTGQPQERTEWHQIQAWGKLAEIMGQYLKKGSQVYIEGKIKTDKWEDQKTGETRYSTKIEANTMQMLGGNHGNNNQQGQQENHQQMEGIPSQGYAAASGGSPNYRQSTYQAPKNDFVPTNTNDGDGGGFCDDDIPFSPYQKNILC